jgi:two-component system, NtrC family, sensor kinase
MNTLYLLRTVPNIPVEALEYLDIADGELMRIAHIARQTLGFYREFSAATSNSACGLIGSVVHLSGRDWPGRQDSAARLCLH